MFLISVTVFSIDQLNDSIESFMIEFEKILHDMDTDEFNSAVSALICISSTKKRYVWMKHYKVRPHTDIK